MNIIICGAGEVGRHAAEVLAAEAHNITIVDLSGRRLAVLDDLLDIRSLIGSGTQADVLIKAGCEKADLFIAATNNDEVNLLAASVAKGIGVGRCIARVHHSTYQSKQGLDYAKHLGIDHLVCPERATAQAIADAVRSPGALAVENFARGKIEMQQLPVSVGAEAVGLSLEKLTLPSTARVAAIDRDGAAFLPLGQTVIEADDVVTLISAEKDVDKVRKLFHTESTRGRRVIILGGTAQSVWVCRALHHKGFTIRLFEPNEERAAELAEKLDWVTVLTVDALDTDALRDERIDQADVFIALTEEDEKNILAAAQARSMGAATAIAVLQRGTYLHLLDYVGIDRAFSPRVTAVAQIQRLLADGPIRQLASLAEGIADVFELRVPPTASKAVNKPLRDLAPQLPGHCIIAAIQRGDEEDGEVFVPGGDSTIRAGDRVIVIGPAEIRGALTKVFT